MTYYNLPLTVPRRLMLFNVFVVKVETSNKIYRCICLNTSYITSVPKGLTGLVCSRSTWLEFACPANQHPQSTVKKVKEKKRKEKKVKEKKSKRSKKKKEQLFLRLSHWVTLRQEDWKKKYITIKEKHSVVMIKG